MKKSPAQRRAEILKHLRQGSISSPMQFAELFDVSVMTIHRDLKQLDAEGYLSKQHGGAIIFQQPFMPTNIEKRTAINISAKQAIGKFVATHLINPEDSIVIDAGSTTLALVNELPDTPMTVMVSGIPALTILSQHKYTDIYSLGGKLNGNIMAFEGTIACDILNKCHFTKAFIGTDGIDLESGLSTVDTANAQLTRLMAKQSKEVYVLADLSKFNRRAFASIINFEDITGIVTEKGISEEFRTVLKQNNVKLFEVDNNES